MKALSLLWLILISISLSQAADKKVLMNLDETQLGVPQIAGVLPGATLQGDIITQTWNLGFSSARPRTFRLTADFKDVKDQLVLTYPQDFIIAPGSPAPVSKPVDWGILSGVKTVDIIVPAHSAPKITVQVTGDADKNSWPAGQTVRRVGWSYTLTELNPVQGETVALAKVDSDAARPWRVTLGDNLGALRKVRFTNEPVFALAPFVKLYQFTVPTGIGCLRVVYDSDKKSYISLRQRVAPDPTQISSGGFFSNIKNTDVRKTIVVPKPSAGIWYLYVSSDKDLSGKFDLIIDCVKGGEWFAATSQKSSQTETIAVGIEAEASASFPVNSPITLICHGRTDGPNDLTDDYRKMRNLGLAVTNRWGRPSFQINWSEGSYWNTITGPDYVLGFQTGFNGPRFIGGKSGAASVIAAKLGSMRVDFFGHSWGTYLGNEIAKVGTKFRRFFALDPAFTGNGYDEARINFRDRAEYSLAIYGGASPLGSVKYSKTADDAAIIHGNHGVNLGAAHREPVLFITNIFNLKNNISDPFSFAIDYPDSFDLNGRIWIKGNDERSGFYENHGGSILLILSQDFNLDVTTNGLGVANTLRLRRPLQGAEKGDGSAQFKVFECTTTSSNDLYP